MVNKIVGKTGDGQKYGFTMQFTSDPPTETVSRGTKYRLLRHNIEQLVNDPHSVAPFLVVKCKDAKTASLVAQAICSYRQAREIRDVISYKTVADKTDPDARQVVVWNNITVK